ncbi:DUF5693 family protein [Halalkalibacter urbisdiaboli]|uniref:DUF5693 family protein n=1 Tax=Halalkalibacter urbisdiaboli TaxID=1960589 RepID=UPI000B43FA88|nr:DUF5693 family protein [Halalkalibacter urbisdiaboli]
MLVKKGLWGLIILALLVSIPSIIERIQVEQNNPTYEVAMAYEQYLQWEGMLDETLTREEIIAKLKEHGLTSMSFEPVTISNLVTEGVLERTKRQEIVHEHPQSDAVLPEKSGEFIKVLEPDHEFVEQIEHAYNNHYKLMKEQDVLSRELSVSFYTYGDDVFMFLPYEVSLAAMPIGFDFGVLQEFHHAGINIIPRLPNQFSNIENEKHYLYEQLDVLANELGANKILFSGVEVVGSGNIPQMKVFARSLKELGFSVVSIDFNAQLNMNPMLKLGQLEEDVVRLFSMTLGKGAEASYATEVDKGIRSYKERNIRIMYINPLISAANQRYHHPGEAERGLTFMLEMLDELTTELGKERLGEARPYQSFSQPSYVLVLTILGAAALLTLMMERIFPKLAWLAGLGAVGLGLLYVVLGMDVALKGLALLTAIGAAIYAGLSVRKVNNWSDLIVAYVVAAAIALIGAWFVVNMLYGTVYVVKVDEFRGVKVLAALPIVIGGLVLFAQFIRSFLLEPVRYWHLAVMVLIVGMLGFYVFRTGNAGMTLPFELQFRQWLENVLYVRPRTSEFLIGFPFFILGLYMKMMKKKAAPVFLVLGFLGFASLVGTFTHLHTPLLISIIRSGYSLLLGFLVGLAFIGIFKLIEHYVYPEVEKRWKA